MKRKLALVAALTAVLSALPIGPMPVAGACPDPDQNPCDIQPIDPFEGLPNLYCKIKKTC